MPIDFKCPECKRHYRVKDELAGKGAKCGKCGHKMQIPAPNAASATAARSNSPAMPQRKPVDAKVPQPTSASPGQPADSWLDEELETSQPAIASAHGTGASCPSCGAALADNAVLCVSCGYDLRTHAKLETRHIIETADKAEAKPKKRSTLSGAASLLRGTVFSFLAAIIGAAIWAGLAMLTDREFGLVAWALAGWSVSGWRLAMRTTTARSRASSRHSCLCSALLPPRFLSSYWSSHRQSRQCWVNWRSMKTSIQ